MNKTVVTIATAALMCGVVVVAETVQQPGQPTQSRVWIENRGEAQAVPVALVPGAHVALNGPVTLDPSTAVGSHAVRQAWDYETLAVSAGSDASALRAAGAQGWEAVGVLSPAPNVVLLMKRPH